jgi:1-aminocyclopropane-1-carboxylate deaminase
MITRGAVPAPLRLTSACRKSAGPLPARTLPTPWFIADFDERHGLCLDWVYVAKMMYGVFALTEEGSFPAETTIVTLITG